MIRTTVVGGWPLPSRYAEQLRQYRHGELKQREAEPVLTAATAQVLREQMRTGVDQITGGELWTDPFLSRLPFYLTGIEAVRDEAIRGGKAGAFYRLRGRLEAPRGLGCTEAFRREARLDARVTKVTCPGPLTLLRFLVLVDPSAFAAAPEATGIVRREVCRLAQAGAREVQIDAAMEVTALRLFDHEPSKIAAVLGKVFQGAANIVRTVHFCFGGLEGASFGPEENLHALLPVIGQLRGKVDRVLVEGVDPGARGLLRHIPREMEVVAGIAAVTGDPEPVDVLVARAREVLQHVPPERLWLSPACGLQARSGQQSVGIVTNLVAAARRCER